MEREVFSDPTWRECTQLKDEFLFEIFAALCSRGYGNMEIKFINNKVPQMRNIFCSSFHKKGSLKFSISTYKISTIQNPWHPLKGGVNLSLWSSLHYCLVWYHSYTYMAHMKLMVHCPLHHCGNALLLVSLLAVSVALMVSITSAKWW